MNLSIADEVVLLRAQVDYLLERLADQPGLHQRPVNWACLDVDQASREWALLTEWVDWIRDRYQLHETVPACWYAHPPQLEELSALHCAWIGTFLDPEARAGDGIAWHELLDRTLQRLRRWDRIGCADGIHRADVSVEDDTDHSQRERVIHADLASREAAEP